MFVAFKRNWIIIGLLFWRKAVYLMFFDLENEKYKTDKIALLDDVIKYSLLVPNKVYKEVKPELQTSYAQVETMKLVEYDKKNAIFTYPAFDERLLERYNRAIFSKDIDRDILPMRGYFNYLSFELKELLFGIVLHKFRYDHVDLKESDERFFNHDRQWEKKEALMWDFETEEFIDVPYDVNTKHKNTQEYKDRLDLINNILSQLEELAATYQDDLIDFIQLKTPTVYVKEFKHYFEHYREFVTKKLPLGLKLNFVYSNITMDEYLAILNKAQLLKRQAGDVLDLMENLEAEKKLTDSYDLYEMIRKFVTSFEHFRSPRREANVMKQEAFEWVLGYIGYSYEKMKLYPNIVEVERRRSRKNQASSVDNEKFIQTKYLEFLKKVGRDEVKPQQEDFVITSEERDDVISEPKNLWNKEMVRLMEKYDWSIDELIKEIQKVHDYAEQQED